MSILTTIKGWFAMLRKSRAKEEFDIETIVSEDMSRWIQECVNIYQGNPLWLDPDDGIDTVNFAKTICSELARLALLGAKIQVDGSGRAEWLQEQIDAVYFQLREWVEYGCAFGTVIMKPNGKTVELYRQDRFEVTHSTNGKIDGAVFQDSQQVGKKYYTRLEYHRFVDDLYIITNRCFVGDSPSDDRTRVDISQTPWANLSEEVWIRNIKKPLFGVLKTPHANNIDLNSPMGVPVFSEAIQELRDLDIAYSRNAVEIINSKRIVLLDSDAMIIPGAKMGNNPLAWEHQRGKLGLPDMVKNVQGDGTKTFYQEINPTLNTEIRLKGINALLSQIGFKAGFSNGYFVFNEKTGMITATQVESDDRRTIQTVKDQRDKIENCMTDLIDALNAFADLYGLAPAGSYEIIFDFGDITYNREEDRARWWGYVQAGKVPAWKFFVKFEGFSEEDAKAMVQEAQPKTPKLFGGEE